MVWTESDRFDPRALPLADRHYNRRKVGSPQYVPPGRCLCLLTQKADALWVTSWPFAEFVRHAWPGAWVNSLFRNESTDQASEMIRQAVAATRAQWEPPPQGIVTFVDPTKVPGVVRHGVTVYGYCYLKAGFKQVGYTKGGLWAWQMLPQEMPSPEPALKDQMEMAWR